MIRDQEVAALITWSAYNLVETTGASVGLVVLACHKSIGLQWANDGKGKCDAHVPRHLARRVIRR
jgi:hypothetical protein